MKGSGLQHSPDFIRHIGHDCGTNEQSLNRNIGSGKTSIDAIQCGASSFPMFVGSCGIYPTFKLTKRYIQCKSWPFSFYAVGNYFIASITKELSAKKRKEVAGKWLFAISCFL